jgi:hypothetical protein
LGPRQERGEARPEEFRKDPAKLQQCIKNAFEFGYFNIPDQARVSGSMTAALFQHEYRRYHDALLPETRRRGR